MKDLENKLLSIEIPKIENDQFEEILRSKLVRKYHSKESVYIKKFRYSIAFACFMVILFISVLIFPEISAKANEIAFKKDIEPQEMNNANYSDDEFFKKFAEDDNKLYYTSIHNPNLKDKIDPDKYREDKTYIIRKYVSKDSKAVMIISEFNKPVSTKHLREASF